RCWTSCWPASKSSPMHDVLITGYSVISPFGETREDLWRGIREGPTPVRPWVADRWGVCSQAVPLAGPWSSEAGFREHRATALAKALVRGALLDAGLEQPPPSMGLGLGSLYADCDLL